MRLLVLLLAVYVLVLSGVSCDSLCQDEPTSAVSQGNASHSGEQRDCKNCSPFSLCASCLGFTVPAAVWTQNFPSSPPTLTPARLSSYQPPHSLEVAVRIWQPPRFV